MGFTPLEGLIMGTRCGDIDPAILLYINQQTDIDMAQLDSILNKESGLKGICGVNDMRESHIQAESGKPPAELAIDMYCYRIKKYTGAYSAALGHVDAIVFTAGIGENAAFIREKVCEGLNGLGIILDTAKNQLQSSDILDISASESPVKILVIPTDGEWEIAQQTMNSL